MDIDLGATEPSLAGVGNNAGAVMLIDLDGGRDDAVGDAAASLMLGAGTDASDASGDAAGSLGEVVGLLSGAVLGGQEPSPAPAGAPVGGSEPAGLAASAVTGGMPLSLPDTAFGAGTGVTIWGLLLAILAGLMVSARRLPLRRR